MSQPYLRRRPDDSRTAGLRQAIVVAVAVLVFAIVDTSAGIRVTRLTRNVEVGEETIAQLESELSYLVRDRELGEGVRARPTPIEVEPNPFSAPDSGRVVFVSIETRDGGSHGEG